MHDASYTVKTAQLEFDVLSMTNFDESQPFTHLTNIIHMMDIMHLSVYECHKSIWSGGFTVYKAGLENGGYLVRT